MQTLDTEPSFLSSLLLGFPKFFAPNKSSSVIVFTTRWLDLSPAPQDEHLVALLHHSESLGALPHDVNRLRRKADWVGPT